MEKKIALLALLTVVFVNTSGQVSFEDKLKSLYRNSVPLIHAEELKTLLKKNEGIILLDTRALEEYNVSHIHNAHFIDYKKFRGQSVDSIKRNTPIVVYCTVGYRSERIGEQLMNLGFTNVRNLYGGIFDWVNKGNGVVDSSGNPTKQVHTYNKHWSQWLSKGVIVY
jgi:rhodanese-related sulfurtransferase